MWDFEFGVPPNRREERRLADRGAGGVFGGGVEGRRGFRVC